MSLLFQQVGVHPICRLAGSWDCRQIRSAFKECIIRNFTMFFFRI